MKKLLITMIFMVLLLFGCESGADVRSEENHKNIDLDKLQLMYHPDEIAFVYGTESYQDVEKNLVFSEIKLHTNSNDTYQQVTCVLKYESDAFIGESDCTIELTYKDSWEVISYDYEPIQLFYNQEEILLSKSKLFQYMNSKIGEEEFYLKQNLLSHTFTNNQLIKFTLSEAPKMKNQDTLIQNVELSFGLNVVNATTEAMVTFKQNYRKEWVIDDFEVNNEKTIFEPSRELIGRWSEHYRAYNEDWFIIFSITNYDEVISSYKGKCFMSTFEDWPRGDMNHRATYDFEVTFDLDHDRMQLFSGKSAVTSSEFDKVELNMVFDEAMNLYCTPIDLELQSTEMFILDQQSDTYDFD